VLQRVAVCCSVSYHSLHTALPLNSHLRLERLELLQSFGRNFTYYAVALRVFCGVELLLKQV